MISIQHLPTAMPSIPQDTWLPDQVEFVQTMGNSRANEYWEARLPPDFRRPPENDMAALRNYITDKYVHKRYAMREFEPPTIENYTHHPVRGSTYTAAAPTCAHVACTHPTTAPSCQRCEGTGARAQGTMGVAAAAAAAVA